MTDIFENYEGYKPLVVNLEDYWETAFVDLPEQLKPMVNDVYCRTPWDELDAFQRLRIVAKYDADNSDEVIRGLYFELFALMKELEKDENKAREESESAKALALHDVMDELDRITKSDPTLMFANQRELRKREESDRFKYANRATPDESSQPTSRSDHDPVLQEQVENRAEKYFAENRKSPTLKRISELVYKETDSRIDATTIARRTYKTWKKKGDKLVFA